MWDVPYENVLAAGGWNVLGYDVGFPIGIPSCELTGTADWIEYYARHGFHVLTYRTVRNRATAGGPYDWVFLADIDQPLIESWIPEGVRSADDLVPRDWRKASTATSSIAPCPEPHVWAADIADARRRLDRLGGHHLLIVSVRESLPVDHTTPEALAEDFVAVALRAEIVGAQAIECDLTGSTAIDAEDGLASCEQSPATSISIVRAVRGALRSQTALLIKVSGNLSHEAIEQLVVPLASERLIDGVSGIAPVRVERVIAGNDGRTLWAQKPGIAGYALRDLSRTFVERLSGIRERQGLQFEIIAMGGVMTAEDVAVYLSLGASAVQTATAAVLDPNIAAHAFAHYRRPVEAAEEWDGVVLEVDHERGTFWASLVRTDAEALEEEAQFEMMEVAPEARSNLRPGAVLRWRAGLISEGSGLVRTSSTQIRKMPSLTEADYVAGKTMASRVAEATRRDL